MAASLSVPVFRLFDHSTGAPLAGGKLFSYAAGTSSPQNTYTDATLGTPNSNPVILDANGEAIIFPSPSLFYKFVAQNAAGVVQWTVDFWSAGGSGGGSGTPSSLSAKNFLLDGGFELWQVGNAALAGTGAGQLLNVDGFAGRVTGGTPANHTWQQVASGRAGSAFALRIQRANASVSGALCALVQNLESQDVASLAGQPVCFSFWIRCGPTIGAATVISFSASIFAGTGTDESWQAAGTLTGQTTVGTTSSVITSQQAWTQYSIAGIVPSNATGISIVISYFCQGTAGTGDYFDFDDFQLEIGSSPTAFERVSAGQLLLNCQRRYYKTFPQAVAPANGTGVTGAYRFFQAVGAGIANQITAQLFAPPNMRQGSGSGVNTYNPSAANSQARCTTTGTDCAATGGADDLTTQFITYTTAAGSAAGNANAVHYTIDHRF